MADTDRPVLDFAVIGEDFKRLAMAVENKIEREFPRRLGEIPGVQYLVLANLRIALNTSEVIRYFCADKPEDPFRKPGFFVAAFPLARTILESLYAVLFLLDDPKTRAAWYQRSSWRDDWEELERLSERYRSDPGWSLFLGDRRAWLLTAGQELGITAQERADLRRVKRWPIPGKMIKSLDRESWLRAHFEYLAEWFYGKLSAAAHHAGPRLIPAMQVLSDRLPHGPFALTARLYKSEALFTSLTVHLALLSECIIAFSLDLKARAGYLWTVLAEYWPPTKALYEDRYSERLQA